MKTRLAKFLSSADLGSRRKCEELIKEGRVLVNGQTVTTPSINIDPQIDLVTFDGKPAKPKTKVYYLLNKPTGYTSTTADKHADKLITELVPDDIFVWPAGRLDRETSGLIILTNDGELTQKLTHPKYEKEKTYIAKTDRPLTKNEVKEILGGIELEDGPIRPDSFKDLGNNMYEVSIHEGRNRLVRRIFEHYGREVAELDRTRIAFLKKEKLGVGEYRKLTEEEVERLQNA